MPLITGRPNFIVIVTDDQDTGSVRTMRVVMNRLAAQGAWFRNFFVTTPVCCPSRSSILTGKYAHNHGVMTNYPDSGGFAKFAAGGNEAATIAVALEGGGYRTGVIGKYLNHFPAAFPESYVSPGWSDFRPALYWENYYDYRLGDNGRTVWYGRHPEDYQTDVIRSQALAFIDSAAKGTQPFFLYLTPYAPHWPATAAPRHQSLFPGAMYPRTPAFNEADVSDKDGFVRIQPLLTQSQIDSIDAEYRRRLQTLQAVDEMVGALLDRLAKYSLLGSTYVFFLSDNGYHMGEHRSTPAKNLPYEEDIRVPLIVRGPGVPSNRGYGALTLNIDLAPTIAELAGVSMPGVIDGRSLVPFLRGAPPATWRTGFLTEADAWTSVRTANHVYMEWWIGSRELYDLRADRFQLDNKYFLASPQRVAQLTRTLAELRTCVGLSCVQPENEAGTASFVPTLTLAKRAVSEQYALPGTDLPQLLRVVVTKLDGTPAPGVTLVWRTTSGHADSTFTTTNVIGVSTNRWTVGPDTGRFKMRVNAPGVLPVDFTAVVSRTLP